MGWFVHSAIGIRKLAIVFVQNFYVCFSLDRITIGSLLGWRERVYSYHEVDLVRSAPRFKGPTGKVISEPAIEIGFSDGHRWSTVRDPVGMTGTQVSRVASLVASRAGKDVEKFEILEWNAP